VTVKPTDQADELGTHLARLIRLFDRMQAQYQMDNPEAVERAAYLLLVHLVKDGPRRPGALAEAVHSDPSTVSRQLAQLVKAGLVVRTPDPGDGRATLIAATDEGRRVFEENRRIRNESLAALLADWPEAERADLTRLLGRFVTQLEEAWVR